MATGHIRATSHGPADTPGPWHNLSHDDHGMIASEPGAGPGGGIMIRVTGIRVRSGGGFHDLGNEGGLSLGGPVPPAPLQGAVGWSGRARPGPGCRTCQWATSTGRRRAAGRPRPAVLRQQLWQRSNLAHLRPSQRARSAARNSANTVTKTS